MQLLEYQAKQLLRQAGLPVPRGVFIAAHEVVPEVALPVVVKSQVPVGGRGKLGGVKRAGTPQELAPVIATVLQKEIKGHKPIGVLLEEALEIAAEYYLSLRVDRDNRCVEYIVSWDGGVEIEAHTGSVMRVRTDDPDRVQTIATMLQQDPRQFKKYLSRLEKLFVAQDCLLLEINPLVRTTRGDLVCADAKIAVDDNARFRHQTLKWPEVAAVKPLGGSIGVIANGAGMAMSTMDTIYAAGTTPANFLDIGGGTGEEVFVRFLTDINNLPGVTSIIINIFAGITRCDDIARGIIAAKNQIPNLVPLFIRLEGTNGDEAAALLAAAGISLEPTLAACVQKAKEMSS